MEKNQKQKLNIFKSRPFYYKYQLNEKLHEFLRNKLVWLLFLCIVMFIGFAVTIGIGYQPDFINKSVLPSNNGSADSGNSSIIEQELPQNIRTFRAISLLFLGWYIVFSAWLIKLGINMIQQKQKKMGFLYCFSFIFGLNVGLLIYEITKLNKYSFKQYISSWFENDSYYLTHQFKRNYSYWISLACLFITSPILWFSLFRNENISEITQQVGYNTNLWFDSFQYFTIETNLLCFIALLAYIINPKWKLFKYNDVLIALASYIVIVSITFNFAIFPMNFESKYKNHPYKLARTTFEHIINPIAFVLSYVLIMFKNNRKYNDYLTTLKYSLIVPAVYGGYVLLTPIMCGTSVYSSLTNTNPALILHGHGGTYAAFLVYIAFALAFSLIITLFWWSNYKFAQKQN